MGSNGIGRGKKEKNLGSKTFQPIWNRISMNILDPKVSFSSIVGIGEEISKLEISTGDKYLKLHRGVMDVTQIDLSSIKIDLNQKSIQQYSPNDGDPLLIDVIRTEYKFSGDHKFVLTPGGMSSLDLVISSLSDVDFWIPQFHWGSWSKILKIYGKNINTFDEFDLENFSPKSGVVMLCLPSNPTGWVPNSQTVQKFLEGCRRDNITVILDLPYYFLFDSVDQMGISNHFTENVIVVSSFSKDIGLSGFRLGYVSTLSEGLWRVLRTRSLYKYNSIGNLPQEIIKKLFTTEEGKLVIKNFRDVTTENISKNIFWLSQMGLLFDEYPSPPVGPFAVVNLDYDTLLKNRVSSVPLKKFTIGGYSDKYSRISVAVENSLFIKYMSQFKLSYSNL